MSVSRLNAEKNLQDTIEFIPQARYQFVDGLRPTTYVAGAP